MQVRLEAVGAWAFKRALSDDFYLEDYYVLESTTFKNMNWLPTAHSCFRDSKQTDRLKVDRHTCIPAHDSSIVVT